MHMTRKMALQKAISILQSINSNDKEISQTIQILQDLIDEIPIKHWTEKCIMDSFEQFVNDHGRYPTIKECDYHPSLPSHSVIKQKYKMSMQEWYDKTFPNRMDRVHCNIINRHKADLALFLSEYERIKPCSSKVYDRNRCPEALCWSTIAHREGTTWCGLIKKYHLPFYKKSVPKKYRKPEKMMVSVQVDLF